MSQIEFGNIYNIKTIRIHHECEGGIEKPIPAIIVWHKEACQVMTNGDREGHIFLSHPHTKNKILFLLTSSYLIFGKNKGNPDLVCEKNKFFPMYEKKNSPSTNKPCLFVCFVALRPKSTTMVMAGRSVHLTTLFPRQA